MKREFVSPGAPPPFDQMVVASARLSASAHKNPYNPLHMDWDFYICFDPLIVEGSDYDAGMHIEIETNGVWRLDDFAGMRRHDTNPDCNIGSFYLSHHRTSSDTLFQVHSVRGATLDIEASLVVDLGDPEPLRVHVRTEVTLDGILVSSYGVQSEPDEQKLMAVAQDLFDVSAFSPPRQLPDEYGKGTLNLYFEPLGTVV